MDRRDGDRDLDLGQLGFKGMASILEFLAANGWQALGLAVLATLLIIAAWTDVREHRIPNSVVLTGVAFALMIAHLPGGSLATWFSGIAVGLATTLPFYWIRSMGAGDVKLMAMVGAFLGGSQMFYAALIVFLVGGALSIAVVARRRAFGQLGVNLRTMALGSVATAPGPAGARSASVGDIPYGVAIAAGTIVYLLLTMGGNFQ